MSPLTIKDATGNGLTPPAAEDSGSSSEIDTFVSNSTSIMGDELNFRRDVEAPYNAAGSHDFVGIDGRPLKIGVVDFSVIQRKFHKTALVRESFVESRIRERKLVSELRTRLNSHLDALEGQTDSLGSVTRNREIQNLQELVVQTESEVNEQLSELANDLQRELCREINDAVADVASREGFDLVFNSHFGINGVPSVAFSRAEAFRDLTQEVIEVLNQATEQ